MHDEEKGVKDIVKEQEKEAAREIQKE